LTFATLYNDVLAHHFSSANYLQYAKDKINEAQVEVVRRLALKTQEATSSATLVSPGSNTFSIVSFISDFLRLRYVKDDTLDKLIPPYPGGMQAFEDDGLRDSVAQGDPLAWAVDQQILYIYPSTPTANYSLTLRYFKLPATITADGTSPEIPSPLHPLLISYAVSKCFRKEGDYQAAKEMMAEFDDGLAKAKVDYQHDLRIDTPAAQVGGAWSI